MYWHVNGIGFATIQMGWFNKPRTLVDCSAQIALTPMQQGQRAIRTEGIVAKNKVLNV